MRRSFWISIAVTAVASSACSAPHPRTAREIPAPALPPRPAFDPDQPTPGGERICDVDPSACPELRLTGEVIGAPASRASGHTLSSTQVYAVQQIYHRDLMQRVQHVLSTTPASGGGRSSSSPAASNALPAVAERSKQERVDLEAQFAIEVADVGKSADYVRALVASYDGTISKDERQSHGQARAEIVLRVASERFERFATDLARVGIVRARSVRATDVSPEERDLSIIVDNLTAALTRYRQLLDKATTPADTLAVERQLERVSSDLDRVKGRLEWLRDRVARATVAVALQSPQPDTGVEEGREPYFSPEVRGAFRFDGGAAGSDRYLGAGLAFRFPTAPEAPWRGLVIDIDILEACCGSSPDRSNTAFDALLGLDIYSAALGGGRRRWLNPYLGLRLGFADTRDRADFAAAAVLGLEVFDSKTFLVDLQARAMAMFGNPDGPHLGLEPSLGLGLGF